jgi:hypothetical protein
MFGAEVTFEWTALVISRQVREVTIRMKSPLSVHVRVALLTEVCTGLLFRAVPTNSPSTYRPALNFTAVVPLPNRS